VVILSELLNYLRFGTNVMAIELNGRIPFTDYVGWVQNSEDLHDGLG
jgi:hypothetical protein